MFERVVDNAYWLYSFYNPEESYKQKIIDIVNSITASDDFAQKKYDALPWGDLYYYFDKYNHLNRNSISKHQMHAKTILACEGYNKLSEDAKRDFWVAFGMSQAFPMGEVKKSYYTTLPAFVGKFLEFDSVKAAEKNIDEESFGVFVEYGWDCILPHHPYYHSSSGKQLNLRYCAHYWHQVVCSHWNEKAAQAFAIYQNGTKSYPHYHNFIASTLSYCLTVKNTVVFEMLLKTMLIHTKKNKKTCERSVCNYALDYDVENEKNMTLLDKVMENYLESKFRDDTFINIMIKVLPHAKKEISARKQEIDEGTRFQHVHRWR